MGSSKASSALSGTERISKADIADDRRRSGNRIQDIYQVFFRVATTLRPEP